jgi:hypothetical protein
MGTKALTLQPEPAHVAVAPSRARVTTYLDFGMTKGGKRTSYDYREDQPAYDLFMGARYLNDLIAYREGRVEDVYHPEDLRDTLRKYTALSVCRRDGERLTYHEVGSSVLGVIDAVNYLNTRYNQLDTRQIVWYGVDNSKFMNAMAAYTHEGYDVRIAEVVQPVTCDLFFAKGVSLLYAIDTEELFCEVLKASRIAVFDYTFSRKARIPDVVGTGLPVTFLNLDECQRGLSGPGKKLILNPYWLRTYHHSPDKVTYDCVYGDEDVVDRYLSEVQKNASEFDAVWARPLIRPPR